MARGRELQDIGRELGLRAAGGVAAGRDAGDTMEGMGAEAGRSEYSEVRRRGLQMRRFYI